MGWWFLAAAVAAFAACLDWRFTPVSSAEATAAKRGTTGGSSQAEGSIVDVEILGSATSHGEGF